MFIVGINRPYYPEIKYFDFNQKEKAKDCYLEFLGEHVEDGKFESSVFIAEIIDKRDIKTEY